MSKELNHIAVYPLTKALSQLANRHFFHVVLRDSHGFHFIWFHSEWFFSYILFRQMERFIIEIQLFIFWMKSHILACNIHKSSWRNCVRIPSNHSIRGIWMKLPMIESSIPKYETEERNGWQSGRSRDKWEARDVKHRRHLGDESNMNQKRLSYFMEAMTVYWIEQYSRIEFTFGDFYLNHDIWMTDEKDHSQSFDKHKFIHQNPLKYLKMNWTNHFSMNFSWIRMIDTISDSSISICIDFTWNIQRHHIGSDKWGQLLKKAQ